MLSVMGQRSFVVAYAYIKTEPVSVALFGLIFLGDKIAPLSAVAILIATAGVIVISLKPGSGQVSTSRSTAIGLLSGALFALSATRFLHDRSMGPDDLAAVAIQMRAHAAANPLAQIRTPYTAADVLASRLLAWPIRQLDACPISEGVCAIVLTRGSPGPGRPAAYLRGRATVTDTYNMGDRIGRPEGDLVELLTLRLAARRALAQAGLSSAAEADVVEIHAPFDHAETMAYAPLGFCAAEDGPALIETGFGHRDGSGPVINPSGGPQAANPVGATALVRLAECALQVMGDAGGHQVPGAATALATGQGGSTQFSTCTVLSGS